MRPKVSKDYRVRHSNCTIATCLVMLLFITGSMIYIWNYATTNHDKNGTITPMNYTLSISLYAPGTNLTGTIRILLSSGATFQILDVTDIGAVNGAYQHPAGTYKLYYEGADNGITFGPITYIVQTKNAVLVDDEFIGVRLTVLTL